MGELILPVAAQIALLAGGTLLSEDLACIAAGLLIRAGGLSPAAGLFGCFAGIYIGDLGLWAAGRLLGRRALAWPRLARRLPEAACRDARLWLSANLPRAILASRFLPGSRLPLYFVAGLLGADARRFALWTFLGALLWTPLLVLLSALYGHAFAELFERLAGASRLALPAAAASLFVLLRLSARALSEAGRARLIASVSRLWRWEFWPSWLFYLPVTPWVAILSIRHRGFSVVTAANPAFPDGGIVGESKHGILSALPERWVVASALIEPGRPQARSAAIEEAVRRSGWSFPLILKPDVGQRGDRVKLVHEMRQADAYLASNPGAVIAQAYHPGPFEAGIFYYRLPGEASGRIFSITDKRFPEVIGDGISTLEDLIWRHPRCRMQARTFLARVGDRRGRVPAAGQRVPLCLAGNHAQGAMFLDGRRLVTPALERRIDGIACGIDGFFFGRFDVRYADERAFMAGDDLAIVELNGITSESTDIYDPCRSLVSAWATLFRQWALLFRIGHLNRRRGFAPTPHAELARRVVAYYRDRPSPALSD